MLAFALLLAVSTLNAEVCSFFVKTSDPDDDHYVNFQLVGVAIGQAQLACGQNEFSIKLLEDSHFESLYVNEPHWNAYVTIEGRSADKTAWEKSEDTSLIDVRQDTITSFIFKNFAFIGSALIFYQGSNLLRIESSSFVVPDRQYLIAVQNGPFIFANKGIVEIDRCSFGVDNRDNFLGLPAIYSKAGFSSISIQNSNFSKLPSGGIQIDLMESATVSVTGSQFLKCGDIYQSDNIPSSGAIYVFTWNEYQDTVPTSPANTQYGQVSFNNNQFYSCYGYHAGAIWIGENIIPTSVKNNFFSFNFVKDWQGAKDILFQSQELLLQAGGIISVTEGFTAEKGYEKESEVRISGFYESNFAYYLNCIANKEEEGEECGQIPCGSKVEETMDICNIEPIEITDPDEPIIGEDEDKEKEKEDQISYPTKEDDKKEEEEQGEQKKKEQSGLSTGGIVAIIVAVVVVVAVSAVIIALLLYKKIHKQPKQERIVNEKDQIHELGQIDSNTEIENYEPVEHAQPEQVEKIKEQSIIDADQEVNTIQEHKKNKDKNKNKNKKRQGQKAHKKQSGNGRSKSSKKHIHREEEGNQN
ncbi:MAG: hypothetical protein EZS28_024531 [Streblomastix strix]|uniref:Right handed beta helix domain-containing protein n=1 Tax=Streblomastix strix TaxID=222440 RepID=A0A5J4VBN6_9EUKA|nr:MAG: hypothetical protein EZS28_024531 [Streblomastix strix]